MFVCRNLLALLLGASSVLMEDVALSWHRITEPSQSVKLLRASDSKHLLSATESGLVQCWTGDKGELVWQKNYTEEFGDVLNIFFQGKMGVVVAESLIEAHSDKGAHRWKQEPIGNGARFWAAVHKSGKDDNSVCAISAGKDGIDAKLIQIRSSDGEIFQELEAKDFSAIAKAMETSKYLVLDSHVVVLTGKTITAFSICGGENLAYEMDSVGFHLMPWQNSPGVFAVTNGAKSVVFGLKGEKLKLLKKFGGVAVVGPVLSADDNSMVSLVGVAIVGSEGTKIQLMDPEFGSAQEPILAGKIKDDKIIAVIANTVVMVPLTAAAVGYGVSAQAYTCTTSGSGSACLTCKTLVSRQADDECATCNFGHFLSGTSCQACESDCNACTDTNTCTECDNNKYLNNSDCLTTCPTGYYGNGTDPVGRTCQACESDCNACTDTNTCTECGHNKYLNNSDCLTTCPAGYYSNGTTGLVGRTCEACESDCNACTDTNTCTECGHNKYLNNSDCLTTCPAGYYGNGTDPVGRTCEACETDCHACSDAITCTTCGNSMYLHNNDCVTRCPDESQSTGTGPIGRTCQAWLVQINTLTGLVEQLFRENTKVYEELEKKQDSR